MTWRAPHNITLPDFIISGAMKSGTTTLHAMLGQHPDVFIPDEELHFFDMDSLVQHPDFNVFEEGEWHSHDLIKSPNQYWQWYSTKFASATKKQLKGEDSTTYLASESAAQRIALQSKKIKLLIMLRQPTARVYSHYWHMVKAGRAMFSFEDTLKYFPHNLLDRSGYLRQLKAVFNHIPKEQIKVILFEDFISNKESVLKEVCEFLDLDFNKLPKEALSLHENKARIPRFVSLHLFKTRLFRSKGNAQYLNHFLNVGSKLNVKRSLITRAFDFSYRLINPLVLKKTERINSNTKQFLDDYFYKELEGLDELLGKNILSKWFK